MANISPCDLPDSSSTRPWLPSPFGPPEVSSTRPVLPFQDDPKYNDFRAAKALWDQMQREKNPALPPIGTFVGVHKSGLILQARTMAEIAVLIGKTPFAGVAFYSEQYGVKDPIVKAGFVAIVKSQMSPISAIAAGTIGSEDTTKIGFAVKNSATGPIYDVPPILVDDGSSFCWCTIDDVLDSYEGPTVDVATCNGIRRDVRTCFKWVAIDNLVTYARFCIDDSGGIRAIGLNVIHRYRHVIDYDNPITPRVWAARTTVASDPVDG